MTASTTPHASRIAFLIGGSRGLGRSAVSLALAADGVDGILTYVSNGRRRQGGGCRRSKRKGAAPSREKAQASATEGVRRVRRIDEGGAWRRRQREASTSW